MRFPFFAAFLALTAAGATTPTLAAPAKAPQPPGAAREAYGDCRWGEVRGKTLSMWGYACGPRFGNVHLEADDALPGFVLASNRDGQKSRDVVVRLFRRPAGAPLAAILPQVRAASPGGVYSKVCVLSAYPAPVSGLGPVTALQPAGAARRAYDKASKSTTDVPDPPCGDLGVGPAGDRIFVALKGDPTAVAYIDMGSEVQPFDPRTLRRLP
ncbi:hypothetical protein BH09PSE2_BH09PSE2_13430 [soil metagenome]